MRNAPVTTELETPPRMTLWPLVAFLAAHPAVVAIDANLAAALSDSDALRLLPLLAIMHCDAAFFGIWATQNERRFRRMLLYCCLSSVSALAFAIFTGADDSSLLKTFCERQPALAMLQTLLSLPLIVILFWIYRHGARREWFWPAAGGILLGFVAIAALTGAIADDGLSEFTLLKQFWQPHESLIRALVIYVVNLTSIFWCAAIGESIIRRQSALKWLGLFAGCVLMVLATSWAIGGNINGVIWTRFGRTPTWNMQWARTMVTPLSIPIFSAMLMIPIAFLLRLLDWKVSSHEKLPLEAPEPIGEDARATRFRLVTKLVRLVLLISAANLVVGFLLSWITIDRHRFGENGMVSELLFMAPLGLWAAQAGLSAVFMQSSILNRWKRMLIVLVWAELSMAAFWGQVALTEWMRADPSDFVGAMFHCAVGGVFAGAIGLAVGQFLRNPAQRVMCSGLETRIDEDANRTSLSLSDLIAIVTAFAAISYPVSVVLALEIWQDPISLVKEMLIKLPWGLATTGAVTIGVVTWLENKRPSYWNAAFCSALLLGCCAHDWASISGSYVESFFGLRSGFRILALPMLFVVTAVGAIGLKRCGFGVAMRPATRKEQAANARIPFGAGPHAEDQLGAAIARGASPWD